MNKWEDTEWVGGGRAQHKVTGEVERCLCRLYLRIGVHHLQRSLLPQKVTGLVEVKSSQPALQRAFQMWTFLRQGHLLGSSGSRQVLLWVKLQSSLTSHLS